MTASEPRGATKAPSPDLADVPALLRAAAAILRRLAANATPGPWRNGVEIYGLADVTGPNGERVCQDGVDWPVVSAADAAWIAAMGPDKAEPLAGWLEREAERWENGWARVDMPHAITFAQAILAATPRQEGQ